MTEWKGPWRCLECGWVSMKRYHPCVFEKQKKCLTAEWVPHDRRAPDPEKQELVEALGDAKRRFKECAGIARFGGVMPGGDLFAAYADECDAALQNYRGKP